MVIARPGTEHAGQVIWLDGQEVDRYVDLREWFASVIEYHRRELQNVVDEAQVQ